MVTLEQIRTDLEVQLQKDKNLNYVEVQADSLEEALADAAVQLDSKVNLLEYEVIESGFAGFAGLMKKAWKIRAFEN